MECFLGDECKKFNILSKDVFLGDECKKINIMIGWNVFLGDECKKINILVGWMYFRHFGTYILTKGRFAPIFMKN
jgi:hypothetical protein